MEVTVVRSPKRRRTVQAQMGTDGVLRVLIPASMSREEEQRWVSEMVGRFQRKSATDEIDLGERATKLARRLRLPMPAGIRWVDNQRGRWGSCTPVDGTIRISSRLAGLPGWVLDYVIVHELCHLVEHGHGKAFKALEARYPKAERAIGYLMAQGLAPGRAPRPEAPAPDTPTLPFAEPA